MCNNNKWHKQNKNQLGQVTCYFYSGKQELGPVKFQLCGLVAAVIESGLVPLQSERCFYYCKQMERRAW